MHINTETLATFLEIQKTGSFSKAATNLGLGQSAVSQKIARLEELLHVSLFIRQKNALKLTASGEELFVFAKQQLSFESDFLNNFNQYQNELAGTLNIAAYSSILESLVIPHFADFMRENPKCILSYESYEMDELINVLKSAKADIIFTDYLPSIPGVESQYFCDEEYVVVESRNYGKIPHLFLDHNPADNATEEFFKHQGWTIDYERNYMGDVFGILQAVRLGLGKAVMSKHLIKSDKSLRIKQAPKRFIRKVYASYLKQSYYSPLFKALKLKTS